MKKPRVIFLRRWVPAAVFCAVAAALMFWVVAAPRVVGTAAATRQLPIYCVQRDYKVCSLTFDAAWGNARLRQGLTVPTHPAVQSESCQVVKRYFYSVL